MKHKGLLGEPN